MSGLRILITNLTLASRTGTETHVRDLAHELLRRGHSAVVYSTDLGEIAREIRAMSVPVVDDLDDISVVPDIIHGHHHTETMTALLHFGGVPAVFVCHDRISWHDTPPRFPRIRRYIAVDQSCRDRLVCEYGIPEEQVRVLLNSVDVERFLPRDPLPPRPERALVFSNYATEQGYVAAVREACRRAGIDLDVLGSGVGKPCVNPESILGQYDLVFAKGRCALEALAVGTAVLLCDAAGCGPLVTAAEFDRLRPLNFGLRTLTEKIHVDTLEREIVRYNTEDAAEVSRRLRDTAALKGAVDQLLNIYEEVLVEHWRTAPADATTEARAAAAYLRWSPWRQIRAVQERVSAAESERNEWRNRHDLLHENAQQLEAKRQDLESTCEQLRQQLAQRDTQFIHLEIERTVAQAGRAHLKHRCGELQAEKAKLQMERDELAREQDRVNMERAHLADGVQELLAACDQLRQQRDRLQAELAAVHKSAAVRIRNGVLRVPIVGRVGRSIARIAAGKFRRNGAA